MRGVLAGVLVAASALAFVACGDSVEEPAATGEAGGNDGSGGAPTTGASGGSSVSSASTSSGGGQGGAGGITVLECFIDDFVNPPLNGPNYDQFSPVVGSHCHGTNHQDIAGVERVVFLGDSVTVGTPPSLSSDYYRSKLADEVADAFGLAPPSYLWRAVDVFQGHAILQEDGAFASCSEWGARTDDLAVPQLEDCFPSDKLDKRTLVIMTVGGNDISSLTQDSIDGVPEPELWARTEAFVELQREAVEWLTAPGRFPNGVFVIFGNMYEFTDGTGEVESCDVSGLAGFDEPVPSPETLADMVIWANEQYVKIAVDTQTDIIFMLEEFCGHGFNADNPAAPCYRGPATEQWFDMTCIHPNPTGHQQITDMFMAVVDE